MLHHPHIWISIGDDCWCKYCGVSNEESTNAECPKNNVLNVDKEIMEATKDVLDGMKASPKAIGQIYSVLAEAKEKAQRIGR